ncbi:MAG: hypothetical protein JJLCMIEE_00389 [Acidimicrobiales bacterium]|nr:MAG: hypothetical protein EDR02_13925 [Actinomycetota bacterium]MBV6507345.1 hypothetical protein [Acidimicrobiales bacterium]RIK04476.1 MAG: hypothetical protein DCC48_13180 [Acidobacteriota bacterium]
MAGRARPVARHDCGVALYAPTTKVKSHRVVWTDPFSGQRSNRRYATRELADEAFEATVAYVKAARAKVGPVKVTRGGPPTVDDLFAAVEQRWKQKNVTARYIEKRRGIYGTWIQPVVGAMAVHEWGSTDQHCIAVLAAARAAGRRPATVQNIGSLLRLMVTVAHRSGLLPRTMQPMDDVDYVAARAADDEAAVYIPPSERPTTEMVEALAEAFDARGRRGRRPWLGQMVRVAGYGGLRLGELTALRAVDVDEDRHGVMVATAWSYSKSKGYELKAPKNGRRRFVLLPRSVFVAVLERAKAVEADEGEAGLLYPGPKGPNRPFTEGELRRVFGSAARKAGWACHPDSVSPKGKTQKGRPVIPWRNLRHHAATWLHEVAEFEWVDVSRLLGHASVAFTQARYVRPASDAEDRNRAVLADL